ncbi:hypothetical protein [Nocardiopsis halotolerans]|uniref:hypothetical protein n=1 Tax=Nocardiopsis halotolerans TaxID=124252 RepID=UPI0003487B21|nr:hypothetical protein [Nocardiopsis halotolerans]
MSTTPETAPPAKGEGTPEFLSPVLTGATFVVLLLFGALVGVVSTTGAGWLTLYWEAGAASKGVTVLVLLVFLTLLYAACRLCAWGSRRASGAVAFTVGYLVMVIAMVGYMPGGDLVLTNHIMHNAYLFGAMLVLVFAVIRSGVFSFVGPGPVGAGPGNAQGVGTEPGGGRYQRVRPSPQARPWRQG